MNKSDWDTLTTPEQLRAQCIATGDRAAYNHFVELLRSKRPFAFSRYGDGDFWCMFGRQGANCDGHTYFPELGVAMKAILESRPGYYVGIQHLAKRLFETGLHADEFAKLIDFPHLPADIFHHQSMRKPEHLNALFDALSTRRVVIVGAGYLRNLKKFPFKLIEIPEKNCFTEGEKILRLCNDELKTEQATLFVFCASMLTKVLIHNLWTTEKQATYLDLGSALDPYAGKLTRKYHRLLELEE